MPADLSVFGRQKTLLDQQALQAAFEQKKALAGLAVQAQLAQASNGGLTAKDLMAFQIATQSHNDDMAYKGLALQQQGDLRRDALDQQKMLYTDKKDEKINLKKANDQNVLNSAVSSLNDQLALIDEVKNKPGIDGNFGVMGMIPNRPGSDASNAKALLDQLNARGFVSAIGNMKSQSATGASGLGALSEREGDKVQNAAAALGKSQDAASFRTNLDRYANELKASQARLTSGFNNIYGDGYAPVATPVGIPAMSAGALNSDYTAPQGSAMPPRANISTLQASQPPQPKQAADGKFYIPDPKRPGKYLRVDQ